MNIKNENLSKASFNYNYNNQSDVQSNVTGEENKQNIMNLNKNVTKKNSNKKMTSDNIYEFKTFASHEGNNIRVIYF